jgi:hypothetical protein
MAQTPPPQPPDGVTVPLQPIPADLRSVPKDKVLVQVNDIKITAGQLDLILTAYPENTRVFALGYRRYEWKCDALNAPSRAAAQRLGFVFEGIFRQANVYKGRNRDTAWLSILDTEWPRLAAAFTRWLDPANFDAAGKQRLRLSDLTR